jgi:hypothetical protein
MSIWANSRNPHLLHKRQTLAMSNLISGVMINHCHELEQSGSDRTEAFLIKDLRFHGN